jgi:type IV secretion system protein VirD4
MNTKHLYILAIVLITAVLLWYCLFALFAGVPESMMFRVDVIKILVSGVTDKPLAKPAALSLLVLVSPVFIYWYIKSENLHKNRFGDARWARIGEINKYGYLGDEGIIIGQVRNKLLYSHGPKTIGLAAAPRSGKGVSFVIPNMLNWPHSAFVIDVKGEIFELTSKFREQHGQEIFVFDPLSADNKSHAINVFDFISRKPENLISEVEKIAYSLMPNGKVPFWDDGARGIFMGIAFYLLETGKHCSIPAIIGFVEGNENLQDKMFNIIQSPECNGMNSYGVSLLRDYAELEPDGKLVSGYLAQFNSHLSVFRSSKVRAATDHTTIDFTDLKESKKTIYMVMRPEDMPVLGKMFGIICDKVVFAMTKDVKQGETGRVMFMLDEFTALGEMKRLVKGAAFLGGYGVRMCIIYQNHAQLESVYGVAGAKELTGLMHERISFASSDIEEAKRVSQELGQRTVRSTSRSYNKGSASRSVSEAGRDLMNPPELMRLNEKKQIILSAGQRPILCNKIFYYKDKRFTPRLLGQSTGIPELQTAKFLEKVELKRIDLTEFDEAEDLS